jgi:hypothetical protein
VRDSFVSGSKIDSRSSNLALDLLSSADDLKAETEKDVNIIVAEAPDEKKQRRRMLSFAKRKRMSLWASTTQSDGPLVPAQNNLFRTRKSLGRVSEYLQKNLLDEHAFHDQEICSPGLTTSDDTQAAPCESVLDEEALPLVFGFLTESELVCSASMVCHAWADAATTASVKYMLASVGHSDGHDDSDEDDESNDCNIDKSATVTTMERSWSYLNTEFPWGLFLSEGSFKKVYKVYNCRMEQEEAISVM